MNALPQKSFENIFFMRPSKNMAESFVMGRHGHSEIGTIQIGGLMIYFVDEDAGFPSKRSLCIRLSLSLSSVAVEQL